MCKWDSESQTILYHSRGFKCVRDDEEQTSFKSSCITEVLWVQDKAGTECDENGIELRIADRWFPSSKICHECGNIKKDLKLSDREYICKCGYHADRDFNASLNLRDTAAYKIA